MAYTKRSAYWNTFKEEKPKRKYKRTGKYARSAASITINSTIPEKTNPTKGFDKYISNLQATTGHTFTPSEVVNLHRNYKDVK